MKKTLLVLSISVLSLMQMNAQKKVWTKVESIEGIRIHKNVTRESFPKKYLLYNLDFQAIKQNLLTAEDRFKPDAKSAVIELPTSSGKIEKFRMFEASNFEPDLQAQFPEIRAYAGIGIDNPSLQVRLSISPQGIQTMIMSTNKPNDYMEVYSTDGSIYAVYSKTDTNIIRSFRCSTPDEVVEANLKELGKGHAARFNDAKYRTFKAAQSCTAEYSNYFGATSSAQVGLVLAAFNNTYTRVNGVFERDFAIHLNLVSQSQNVIFYNPTTDPYSDSTTGTDSNNSANANGWNIQLQNTLNTRLTGPSTALTANNAAYDIGHLFGGDGGGGNAGCIGCVCVNPSANNQKQKGSGYTSPGDGIPSGDNFDIDFVVHEMGHQLGGNHTFTHSTENNPTNYEVGSGVTIMGYAGITSYDVASHSIETFHAGSIAQIQANILTKTCDVETSITHGVPVVNAGSDYSIPFSTPFTLTGSATDTGGGSLTYQWEQFDQVDDVTFLTTGSPASTGKIGGPNFRTYLPTSTPSRTFPNWTSVLNLSATTQGAAITVEALSSVARTLNFRLTVRDNVVTGGQTGFDDMIVNVVNKTPLTVTVAASTTYPVGSTQTVVWTGATGTSGHNTIAGATNVDISFSADNGLTWTTLLTGTPNDGSQAVTLPAGVSGAYCRFMVKASANIFFNVSRAFAVGNYTYQAQNVCTDYPFTLNSAISESADNTYPGISLTINDSYTITDANFYVSVTHPEIGQFNLLIMAPWQTALNTALWYNNTSCTGANLNKWFDTTGSAVNCANTNSTGAFLPYSVTNINNYNTNNSAGAWKFYFKDSIEDGNNISATLNSITIQLCRSELLPVLVSESFNSIDDLTIYPNPNNGTFTINFQSESDRTDINIHDIRGRKVFNKSFENNGLFNQNISLNNVQSGIYLVTIQDGARKITKKIVIE